MKRFEAVHYNTDYDCGWEVRPVDEVDPWPVFSCMGQREAEEKVAYCHSWRYRTLVAGVYCLGRAIFAFQSLGYWVMRSLRRTSYTVRCWWWGWFIGDVIRPACDQARKRTIPEFEYKYELIRRSMTSGQYQKFLWEELQAYESKAVPK